MLMALRRYRADTLPKPPRLSNRVVDRNPSYEGRAARRCPCCAGFSGRVSLVS